MPEGPPALGARWDPAASAERASSAGPGGRPGGGRGGSLRGALQSWRRLRSSDGGRSRRCFAGLCVCLCVPSMCVPYHCHQRARACSWPEALLSGSPKPWTLRPGVARSAERAERPTAKATPTAELAPSPGSSRGGGSGSGRRGSAGELPAAGASNGGPHAQGGATPVRSASSAATCFFVQSVAEGLIARCMLSINEGGFGRPACSSLNQGRCCPALVRLYLCEEAWELHNVRLPAGDMADALQRTVWLLHA